MLNKQELREIVNNLRGRDASDYTAAQRQELGRLIQSIEEAKTCSKNDLEMDTWFGEFFFDWLDTLPEEKPPSSQPEMNRLYTKPYRSLSRLDW